MPLEQYDNQFRPVLADILYDSILSQIEDELLRGLTRKLRFELEKECLGSDLDEELEHQCL